ncbi:MULTISPECIES: MFS transporter [unclassified Rhodococcus (in: high G+C Gram-positive bacteria)]|uniref:MFS transporter n=1 Tax=unclassified Rhodococcus (in: high G+C Gram-positive bacteria) TaxID=192944 RepID=UPI0006FFF228|nr:MULTISPECIES: MFS transporter [unclassified Rhodococcus (in: high G+C Gram-positive bacteria)]KQU28642.1 MFS transporter [Rhodococcus sp. Leaf225]KQU47664.1 MFS transporter [Rhodococcus sp. Leaf258]
MSAERSAAPWLVPLCASASLLQSVYVAVRVLLSYRVLELDGGGAAVGALTAAYSLAPLLIAIPVGRVVDGRFLSVTLRAGAIVSVVAVLVIAVADSIPALAVGSVVLGVGNLLTMVASQSYIPHHGDDARFDRRFGTFSLWVSVGQTGGLPVAGSVASTSVGTTGALVVMAAIAGLASAVTFIPGLDTPASTVPTSSAVRQSTTSMLADRGMRAAIFSSLIVLSSIDLLAAYLPLLGDALGWSVLTVTVVLTARSVASIVSRVLLPRLLDRVPRRALLIAGTAATAVPVAVLPLAEHPAFAAVSMSIAGFFWGIAQPLTMTWVASSTLPSSRGAALSLRMTGNRLGQVLIPAAAGLLVSATGIGAVFIVTGALLSLAGVSTWRNTSNGR